MNLSNILWGLAHLFDTTPRIHSNFGATHKNRMVQHNLRFNWSDTDLDVANKQRAARRMVETMPNASIEEITDYMKDY